MSGRKKRALMNVDEVVDFFNNIILEKPYLPLLIPLILILWAIEKWIFSLSNWFPLVLAVWATIQASSFGTAIFFFFGSIKLLFLFYFFDVFMISAYEAAFMYIRDCFGNDF